MPMPVSRPVFQCKWVNNRGSEPQYQSRYRATQQSRYRVTQQKRYRATQQRRYRAIQQSRYRATQQSRYRATQQKQKTVKNVKPEDGITESNSDR